MSKKKPEEKKAPAPAEKKAPVPASEAPAPSENANDGQGPGAPGNAEPAPNPALVPASDNAESQNLPLKAEEPKPIREESPAERRARLGGHPLGFAHKNV